MSNEPVHTRDGVQASRRPGFWVWVSTGFLLLFLFLSTEFIGHAVSLGWQGLSRDLSGESRLYWPEAQAATAAIFLHMIGGAVITALAPLQLVGPLRRRWPRVHRWSGRVLIASAMLTGLAGLVYIASRGTIGGWDMSLSFAIYGLLTLLAAAQTLRFALAGKYDRHRRWGLRLAVLAVGSWLYRLHYGLWFLLADGVGVEDGFTGPFDLINIWAFYLPYLALLECVFLLERRRARPVVA